MTRPNRQAKRALSSSPGIARSKRPRLERLFDTTQQSASRESSSFSLSPIPDRFPFDVPLRDKWADNYSDEETPGTNSAESAIPSPKTTLSVETLEVSSSDSVQLPLRTLVVWRKPQPKALLTRQKKLPEGPYVHGSFTFRKTVDPIVISSGTTEDETDSVTLPLLGPPELGSVVLVPGTDPVIPATYPEEPEALTSESFFEEENSSDGIDSVTPFSTQETAVYLLAEYIASKGHPGAKEKKKKVWQVVKGCPGLQQAFCQGLEEYKQNQHGGKNLKEGVADVR